MYARGMSQRDISATIDDIYGFKLSAEQIFKITDYVLEEQEFWALDTRKREQTHLGADIRRTQGTRRSASRIHFYGRRVRAREERKGNFPGGRCLTLHCSLDSQFSKVCPDARLQGFHRPFEKNLRRTESQSLPRRI